MTLIAYIYRKLQTANDVVREVSKKSHLRKPFDKRYGKQRKYCWNIHNSSYIIFIDHYESNWVGKKSLLVICEILGLFVNTLTADDKYSRMSRDNLTQPIKMQLLKIVIITSDHKSTTHYRQWQAIQKFVYFFSKTFQIILMYCFLLSYFKNVLESTNMVVMN